MWKAWGSVYSLLAPNPILEDQHNLTDKHLVCVLSSGRVEEQKYRCHRQRQERDSVV